MRRSIRWELPISYAIVALLAAVALGAALLLFLRSYYGRVERRVMEGNALAFSYALTPLLEEEAPDGSLQAEVISLSFLSQARVRLLDSAKTTLADSSSTRGFAIAVASRPGALPPAEAREVVTRTRSLIAIEPLPEGGVTVTRTQSLPSRLRAVQRWMVDPQGTIQFRLERLAEAGYPLVVGGDAAGGKPQPGIVVQQPIYSEGGDLLGYVELSEGPSYGQEIVASVAVGWFLASVVAVVLAAAVGWLASRRVTAPLLALTEVTASMAEGDLAARANVAHRDEFGTLARSFNSMADRVEDTVLTLRRFVSDAAHELNTPLATLRANLDLIRQAARSEASTPQAQRLARAGEQVERLEVLTRGMLDLSRIESGAGREESGPVSLAGLAREAGELYASRAEQAGLEFELSLPAEEVTVKGDAGQLRQAVMNLLDNAIKFTPKGGRVRLTLVEEGDMAVLQVADTGIGIPEEDVPHLFQRFHRGRNAGGYPGSGLGLVIVKAVAEGHGGEVRAESGEGSTTINLRLPLQ